MKKSRYNEEQIVRILREADRDSVVDVAKRHGVSEASIYAWRKFALTLLRQDQQYPKRSLRSRRKTADRIPDYRASLLGLAP